MISNRATIICIMPLIWVLVPVLGIAQGDVSDEYEFSDLTEITRIENLGLEIGGADSGGLSDFRRAFFVDERAVVIQLQETGRYYLLILETPSDFSGRCARRPEAILREGGTYFLACGVRAQPIARSYIFENREQMLEVTDRLRL